MTIKLTKKLIGYFRKLHVRVVVDYALGWSVEMNSI